MAARCGHILLSFVLVLVLVLVPCCFCFSSPSCSCRAPSASRARRARRARRGALLSSLSTLCRRGSRCPGCPPAPRIFFACVLVLLLEEQRRENPHATAGTFASKIVPSPVRRAYLPKLSSQKIHHLVTNSTEQQSAHRQMARISRQAFFPSAAGLRGRGKPLQAEPAVEGAAPLSRGGSQGELMGPVTQYHR